ncbi:MAG: hypothetical protein GEV05_27860 [Betaproteobacteria bacterium]|nr:hypothetical protein [Betaproteobacteria bacterium]
MPQPAALCAIDASAVHAVIDDPANNEELERVGITLPCYFVLRPDGYIALTGGRLMVQDIERYFAGRDIRLLAARSRSGAPVCELAPIRASSV